MSQWCRHDDHDASTALNAISLPHRGSWCGRADIARRYSKKDKSVQCPREMYLCIVAAIVSTPVWVKITVIRLETYLETFHLNQLKMCFMTTYDHPTIRQSLEFWPMPVLYPKSYQVIQSRLSSFGNVWFLGSSTLKNPYNPIYIYTHALGHMGKCARPLWFSVPWQFRG